MLYPTSILTPLPADWQLYAACDTGTYMSAGFIAVDPIYSALLVLEEFPNYRYVGGEIELLDLTMPAWASSVHAAYQKYRPGTKKLKLWVDQNSQFKSALRPYGLHLQSNLRPFEVRVEIAREYMQASDPPLVYFAPWLSVLPYEMENAVWPKDSTSAGRFERLKVNDHTLDWFEHVCSRRPRRKLLAQKKNESFLDRFLRENRWTQPTSGDPHLGRL